MCIRDSGGTDTKQDLYNKDTSPAVKKLCSAWNITAEQAIEMLKNHANDEKTLYVNKETYDNTAYTISDVKIKPTEKEKTEYNIQVDDDGYASVDTSYNYGVNSDLEGSTKDGIGGLLLSPIAALIQGIGDGVNYLLQRNIIGDKSDVFLNSGVFEHSKMIEVLNENKPVSGVPQVDIAEEYIEKYGAGVIIEDMSNLNTNQIELIKQQNRIKNAISGQNMFGVNAIGNSYINLYKTF